MFRSSMLRLRKIAILSLFLLFLWGRQISFAAIDPKYKECMQRGYGVQGDSCKFPDGSLCALTDFNAGNCGSEWLTMDYCVEEGEYVWDEDRCCEGLAPYLPQNANGQATCQPAVSAGYSWLKSPILWAFVAMGLALIVAGIRKMRSKNA